MKIAILTEGGSNIGFGHITRCSALYEVFNNKETDVVLYINGDPSIEFLIEGKKFVIMQWLEEKKAIFKIIKNYNIVIVDSYLADYDFYHQISQLVPLTVYIDDTNRIEYPKGILINWGINAKYFDYSQKNNIYYLLGPDYSVLRKDFWQNKKKIIKKSVKSVLISFGANDFRNLIPKILKILNAQYPTFQKKVIITQYFGNIDQIESEKNETVELCYFPNASEMKKLMLEADIAISTCGQTVYELAVLGVPTIGIVVIENQIPNVKGWVESGFLEYAGSWDENDLIRNILKKFLKLMHYGTRKKKSEIGQKFINAYGVKKIKDFIIQHYHQLS